MRNCRRLSEEMLQNTELWLYISVMSSGSLKIIPKIIPRHTAV